MKTGQLSSAKKSFVSDKLSPFKSSFQKSYTQKSMISPQKERRDPSPNRKKKKAASKKKPTRAFNETTLARRKKSDRK